MLVSLEKSDEDGAPILREAPDRLEEYVTFMARNAVTEMTWSERITAVQALGKVLDVSGDRKEAAFAELNDAIEMHAREEITPAYEIVSKLMVEAKDNLKQKT